MKKIIGFIAAMCILALPFTAIAEDALYFNDGGITIEGKAPDVRPGEKVTLLVTPSDVDWLDESVREEKNGEHIVYFGTEDVAEGGSYAFKIYLENNGKYNVYLTEGNGPTKTGEPEVLKEIIYINKQKNAEAVSELKAAIGKSTSSDTTSLMEALEENSSGLGLYDKVFDDEKLDFEGVAEISYDALSDVSKLDTLEVIDILEKAAVADMLNNGVEYAVKKYSYILYDEEDSCYDEADEEVVYDYLKETDIKSIDELDTLSKEAVVMAAVNSGNVSKINTALKNVFVELYSEYKNKISLDLCTKIAKDDDWTLESLTEYIEDYKETTKGPSVSSGSGGGGGTGARPSVNIPTTPAYKEEINNFLPFRDIENVKWAQEAIVGLYNKGCINGREEGIFAPGENILREEFLKILITAFDLELIGTDELPFSDVNKDAWYYNYIKTAYLAKVTNGISEDMFGIGQNITRQDLCKMTVNLMDALGKNFDGENNITFKDEEKIAPYAKDAVGKLVMAGIISGNENGEFNPGAPATRAEAAKILYYTMTLAK